MNYESFKNAASEEKPANKKCYQIDHSPPFQKQQLLKNIKKKKNNKLNLYVGLQGKKVKTFVNENDNTSTNIETSSQSPSLLHKTINANPDIVLMPCCVNDTISSLTTIEK